MLEKIELGLTPYIEALELQKEKFNALVEYRRNPVGEPPAEALITLHHTPVYTLGRRANPGNVLRHLPGVDVVKIERGGDVTFHGPGQLVVYPIIDLQCHRLGVKSYVNILEECVILTLAEWDITGGRVEGATGVWLDIDTPRERKICAIGVKCSRFCSMHGLALNVNTDLNYFTAINPCGFVDRGVTSMQQELGCEIDFEAVRRTLSEHLLALLH